jgi:general secretion pathway protein A
MTRRRLGISPTVSIAAAALTLAALTTWSIIIWQQARAQASATALKRATQIAQAVGYDHQRLVEATTVLLFRLGQRPDILDREGRRCQETLADTLKTSPEYLQLVVATPEGAPICVARGTIYAAPDFLNSGDVRRTIESGRVTPGQIALDRSTRRGTMTLTAPMVGGRNELRGVIVAALDLSVLARPLFEIPPVDGASMAIIDRGGTVLMQYPDAFRWTGTVVAERGAGLREQDLDGRPAIVAVMPLLRDPARAGDATVFVAVPHAALYRDANAGLAINIAGLGLIAVVIAVAVALRMERPLERIVRAVTDVMARFPFPPERPYVSTPTVPRATAVAEDGLELTASAAARVSEPPLLGDARTEVATEAYWNLREPAFGNAPNPAFLYLSPGHEAALLRLTHAVRERRGCALLTGEPGCGKTTVIRAMLRELPTDRYDVALVAHPIADPTDLLAEILYELGVDNGARARLALLHELKDLLARNYRANRDTVVVVDDSQVVNDGAWFDEIGLLVKFQADERALITIVLVGSPELLPRVATARLLDASVTTRCHLSRLDAIHTAKYVAHRLARAGHAEPIFTERALRAIWDVTRGMPREINNVCDTALWAAARAGLTSIDEHLVRRVAALNRTLVEKPPAVPPAVPHARGTS